MTLLPGFLELLLIALIAALTAFVFLRKHAFARWLIVTAISVTAAAILTPADLLSTLVLSGAFFGMAILGSRIGVTRQSSAG